VITLRNVTVHRELAGPERELDRLSQQNAEVERLLGDPVLCGCGDGERIEALNRRGAALEAERVHCETRWLEIGEAYDAAAGAGGGR